MVSVRQQSVVMTAIAVVFVTIRALRRTIRALRRPAEFYTSANRCVRGAALEPGMRGPAALSAGDLWLWVDVFA